MKHAHLVLFDDVCPLCLRSVSKIRSWDCKQQFRFAPLTSDEAKKTLRDDWEKYKNANTLILIENEGMSSSKIWIKGRAVMRILWLLGGWRKLVGWLAFIPLGVDQVYAFIAKRRHHF